MTDPKMNVTNFGYTNNWYDSACTNLNPSAYLTSITDALGHVSKFSYYTCTGLKESAQDPNDIAASRPGTTFTYDALGRPRITTYADGGQITNTYVDQLQTQSQPPHRLRPVSTRYRKQSSMVSDAPARRSLPIPMESTKSTPHTIPSVANTVSAIRTVPRAIPPSASLPINMTPWTAPFSFSHRTIGAILRLQAPHARQSRPQPPLQTPRTL